jgi:hypothetical protein
MTVHHIPVVPLPGPERNKWATPRNFALQVQTLAEGHADFSVAVVGGAASMTLRNGRFDELDPANDVLRVRTGDVLELHGSEFELIDDDPEALPRLMPTQRH